MSNSLRVTITKDGILPIPDVILEKIGLKLGDKVYLYEKHGQFILDPKKSKATKNKKYMGQSVVELI